MSGLKARFSSSLKSFFGADRGSVMVTAAVFMPLIATASLFAVDHVAYTKKTAALQKAADAAAIAAAGELHFIQTSRSGNGTTLDAIAESYARMNLPGADVTAQATAESDTLVNVTLSLVLESPLGQIFDGERTLTATATAEIYGGQNICIIAADLGWNDPGIQLEGQSEIQAGNCGIYSNSKQRFSIRTEGGTHIDAKFICSAGGYEGADSNFSTGVTTDCAQIKDPLRDRPAPVAAACDPSLPTEIGEGETVNLSQGTYCGGLKIHSNASVWLAPGIYVFQVVRSSFRTKRP